jgi:hypothetical protein
MPSRSLKRTGWKQILQNGLQNEMTKATLSNGAPEEIRTPDPQIRSLILSNSLTFLNFP